MPTEVIGDNTGDDYPGTIDNNIYESLPDTLQGGGLDIGKYEAGGWRMGLLAFTGISSLPSSISVSAATVYGYLTNSTSPSSESHVFTSRRCLRDWVEAEATWNNYATGSAWGTAGGTGAADRSSTITTTSEAIPAINAPGYELLQDSAQLRSDIEDFAAGTLPNYGWHIERTDDANTGEWRVFDEHEDPDGQRPYLSVTYTTGGPITLTTEAGAWVAGGADSLLDRTLATEPGSHAWTGALSTLARALLTEPGAWTVAGALSDLVRALSTEPGAWVHSGQDSEFFIGLTLSTEPGTWTHAGIDAPILRGLATEPGAWAWAGQDSDLITGVVLVTEAGTWQLAGAEGLLIRNLDTEAGAHTWAGGDADLFTGIIIETEPGVWTLVGQLSDLPRNFDTEAGTWIQVGRDSSVVIPGQYYLEEAIAMAAQIIFDLRSNTTLTLDAGGANEVTNLRAIRQARSFDPNVGLRFVHSDETEFLIEKETPRDGAGDPIVGDVVLRRGMTLLDETNAESFVIRRIEYDRSGITRIGVVVP